MTNFFNPDINSMNTGTKLESAGRIYRIQHQSRIKYWLMGILLLALLIMFLPWTQNIRAKGIVTTLRQEQRPQQMNSIIAGTAIKWYVKEGDFVKAGDTILQLGEVKVDYFDPRLLERTEQQIQAKQQTIDGYKNKARTTVTQSTALNQARALKLQSLESKIAQQQFKVK